MKHFERFLLWLAFAIMCAAFGLATAYGCSVPPEPITVELEDAGHFEPLGPAPVECLMLPPEMQGCGSCHIDRRDVAGWYLRPTTFPAQTFFRSPGLSSDTWGRWAFLVLYRLGRIANALERLADESAIERIERRDR